MDRNEKGQFIEGNKSAEKWTEEELIKLGDELLEWMLSSKTHIWFKDFFTFEKKMVYRSLVSYLVSISEPFSERIELAKQIQESRLVNGGLTGEILWKASEFILKSNMGWSDKQEIAIEDNRDKVIQIELLETKWVEPQPKEED